MKDGELRFDSLKEARDWYFVEYAPPIAGNPFAIVQLTILSDSDAADHARIASAMERELERWLKRYRVPVMVSAFNTTGALIHLEPEKSSDYLMGKSEDSEVLESVWGLLDSQKLPPHSPDVLRSIYHDIPFRTAEDIRTKAAQELRRTMSALRLSLALLIFWLVVIPVSIALLGVANPLIGAVVLIYSLWKAFVQLMKLLGKWPEGRKKKEQSERKRRMEHYFWHCERNPEGFQRLKFENFDREERERTAIEAAKLSKP